MPTLKPNTKTSIQSKIIADVNGSRLIPSQIFPKPPPVYPAPQTQVKSEPSSVFTQCDFSPWHVIPRQWLVSPQRVLTPHHSLASHSSGKQACSGGMPKCQLSSASPGHTTRWHHFFGIGPLMLVLSACLQGVFDAYADTDTNRTVMIVARTV